MDRCVGTQFLLDSKRSSDSPEVLRAIERMATLVLDNEQLLAHVNRQLQEVRDSRRRIVEAGDAERIRIERNMHDAVQQRLVAAALLLRRAERGAAVDHVPELLGSGAQEVETALQELREVVRGFNPPVLGERGLLAAIESITERSTVAVRVTAASRIENVPPALAATAYCVAAEAVTNAEKHARATLVAVGLQIQDDSLLTSVDDNGVGGAMMGAGGGLAGLRDRVEAYGGSLDIDSTPGRGTRLVATLPLSGVRRERGTP
ncbi:MAG: Two-component system sensor kinase [Cryobacterium sp.]|nr:Two-component system sensor kinase [Cryobacterium sp.]